MWFIPDKAVRTLRNLRVFWWLSLAFAGTANAQEADIHHSAFDLVINDIGKLLDSKSEIYLCLSSVASCLAAATMSSSAGSTMSAASPSGVNVSAPATGTAFQFAARRANSWAHHVLLCRRRPFVPRPHRTSRTADTCTLHRAGLD